VQTVRSRWFLSAATHCSALLYAALVTALAPLGLHPASSSWSDPHQIRIALFGLLTGWLLGVVRERSLSLWPGILAQWGAVLVSVASRELGG
jgi:hypothetical protein